MHNQTFKDTILYQDKIIQILEESKKPLTAGEVAEHLDTTTQKTAAMLRMLENTGVVYRKIDGNKAKYSDKEFKTMDSFINGYKWYDEYPYIVVHNSIISNMLNADRGFRSLTLAIIYAEVMSIMNNEEYSVVDNR